MSLDLPVPPDGDQFPIFNIGHYREQNTPQTIQARELRDEQIDQIRKQDVIFDVPFFENWIVAEAFRFMFKAGMTAEECAKAAELLEMQQHLRERGK